MTGAAPMAAPTTTIAATGTPHLTARDLLDWDGMSLLNGMSMFSDTSRLPRAACAEAESA
jgi:hypothetical protein